MAEESEKESKFYVYFLTCFATIGGLLFGYDTGIVSGAMLLIGDVFSLSTVWKEVIVSGTIGTAALFSICAGSLTDKFGRKKVIMSASFVFTVGAVVMAVSKSKEILLVGRIIVGIGIGFASMSVPVYIAEAAPPKIRGALTVINQLFITVGILVSSIIAGAFSTDKENGWRYMLGLAGIPSLIQFVGFFFLPESPRWLVLKGREEEALKALQTIRATKNVEKELEEIKTTVDEDASGKSENAISVFIRMLKTQPVRKALVLGCLLQFFQQLCGINTVIYYSASILRLAGFPSELAIWLVCVPNAVNMLATFIGIFAVDRLGRRILTLSSFIGIRTCFVFAVDRLGRRILTLSSFIGIIIALVILAAGFQLSVINTPNVSFTEGNDTKQCYTYSTCDNCITSRDCGFCFIDSNATETGSCLPLLAKHEERYASDTEDFVYRCNQTNYEAENPKFVWANNYCPTNYAWMAILGLALFVIGFAPGLGPMPWTINAEIYPTWARGTGTSLATGVNWIANLIVSFTFLTLLENITTYGTFYLFGGISLVGLITLFFILPETKDKTLEEIEELFMSESYKHKHRAQKAYAADNEAYKDDTKL